MHHKGVLLFLAVLLIGLAELSAQQQEPNRPPEGFVALLNGDDLSGWRGDLGDPIAWAALPDGQRAAAEEAANASMREHWQVVDGILVCDGQGENLMTAKDYENFELFVDWKIESDADSGVYLRGTPQIQIWDPWAGAGNRPGSGGLFNNQKHPSDPLLRADRPIGEWNTFYIMMMGNQVSVKLNDKLVVDDVTLENYWNRAAPVAERGRIGLQSLDGRVCFRNIFLRELPSDPSPPWEILFDGSNLDKWEFSRFRWRIEEGVIAASQRRRTPGNDYFLWTKESFGDFILDLEFKMTADCDSGIFIRTADSENPLETGLEIQIRDSHGKSEFGIEDCGTVRGLIAPRRNAARAVDEWNHMQIVAQDNLLAVVLNDQRLIDADLSDLPPADGDPERSSTTLASEGLIGFQDDGHPVLFRNVRIKRLD